MVIPSTQADTSSNVKFPEDMTAFQRMLVDIQSYFKFQQTWRALAAADISAKYRRTMLGPWWLTVSQGVMAFMMALVSGRFLGAEMAEYLPHFIIAITVWGFISSSLVESSQTLINAGGMIKATTMPLSVHIMRMVQRNAIILMHNFAVVPIVWLVYRWSFGFEALIFIVGLCIVYVFTAACSTLISIICVRYRDVPPLVQAVMQMLFFISPIIWLPQKTQGGHLILALNPMNYLLAVVRDPLLARPFNPTMWIGALGFTAAAVFIAALFYTRYRSRVVYWV